MDRREMGVTWEGAAQRLQALSAANRRAWIEWLDSLDVESSIRAFEDLCRAHPDIPEPRLPKDPPVVLFTIWKR